MMTLLPIEIRAFRYGYDLQYDKYTFVQCHATNDIASFEHIFGESEIT